MPSGGGKMSIEIILSGMVVVASGFVCMLLDEHGWVQSRSLFWLLGGVTGVIATAIIFIEYIE